MFLIILIIWLSNRSTKNKEPEKQAETKLNERGSPRKKIDRNKYIIKFLEINNYKLTLKNITDIKHDSTDIWTLSEFRNYIDKKYPNRGFIFPPIDESIQQSELQKSLSVKRLSISQSRVILIGENIATPRAITFLELISANLILICLSNSLDAV